MGVFNAFVGEAQTLLDDVQTQHPGKADGWVSGPIVAGVERGDGVLQRSPRSDGFNVSKETSAPRQLLLRRIFQFGKLVCIAFIPTLST